jgi:hypothetical protein
MNIDDLSQNKMITEPPAKKGFHFAATLEHKAAYIEAETIEEAEKLYHAIKLPLTTGSFAGGWTKSEPDVGGTVAPAPETEQISTPSAEEPEGQ